MIHLQNFSPSISPVIAALGADSFEDDLLAFLNGAFGVEHYSVFRMRRQRPEFMGGASVHGNHAVRQMYARHSTWQQSAADFREAQKALGNPATAVVARSELLGLDGHLQRALKHFEIVDRVMVCGASGDDTYGVSLLRSRDAGCFSDACITELRSTAEILVALIAKHAALCWDRTPAVSTIDSVDLIEARLRGANWGISERELQVSARILCGISALGIGHELGLREDTIATYRKRLYQRLQISSRHELLRKYFALG